MRKTTFGIFVVYALLAATLVAGCFHLANAYFFDPLQPAKPETRYARRLLNTPAVSKSSQPSSWALHSENKVKKLSEAIVARFASVPKHQAVRIVKAALTESAKQGIEPTLILAVCAVESSFKPDTISGKDHGLMQVNVHWQKDVTREAGGPRALLDPVKNIQAGTKVLAAYKQAANGNLWRTLRKYNGEGKANQYPDTVLSQKAYFDAVLRS